MRISISHLTGNSNVRACLNGLVNENLLHKFYVSLAFSDKFIRKIPICNSLKSDLSRRVFQENLLTHIVIRPTFEISRLVSLRIGLNSLRDKYNPFSIDKVVRKLDSWVAQSIRSDINENKPDLVYCYEDMAYETFTEAKKCGIKCVYDLPIGYWRAAHKMLDIEKTRNPEWAPTIGSFQDSKVKNTIKDQEIMLADLIVVASSFTKSTLVENFNNLPPIKVIPYGFPLVNRTTFDYVGLISRKKIRLLFVGSLTQRKGLAEVFKLAKKYESFVELTLIGSKPSVVCKPLEDGLRLFKWYPTLTNIEVLKMMSQNDILIFPSLFEGFGLVISESMSVGTPVICTERTGGPDIITKNKDGWIIDAGNFDQLCTLFESLLSNKKEIILNGKEALNTASLRTWEQYGQECAKYLRTYFNP